MSIKSSSFDDISCDTTINEDENNNNDKNLEEKKTKSNDPESLDPRIQVSLN